MVGMYLLVCIFIHLSDSTTELVGWINSVLNSDVSSTVIFWVGLFIVILLEAILD